MAKDRLNNRINDLIRREEWKAARELLEAEREKDPHNHWILTQLGVTWYEQKKYEKALELFLASLDIVADCPLTLWNLAGTLAALGKYSRAMRIYTWLLQSEASPVADPCWESQEWADTLKADSVYRLGGCFQRLGKKRKAEHCYHQYLNLLSVKKGGTYSLEDVMRQIGGLKGTGKNGATKIGQREAIDAALKTSGIEPGMQERIVLPPSRNLLPTSIIGKLNIQGPAKKK